jgi:hypothetical protein
MTSFAGMPTWLGIQHNGVEIILLFLIRFVCEVKLENFFDFLYSFSLCFLARFLLASDSGSNFVPNLFIFLQICTVLSHHIFDP